MSSYSRFEVLMGTFIVGLLELLLAFVALTPSQFEPLHVVLSFKGLAEEFALAAFILAFMLMYGATRPKRKCRHIGLTLSGVLLLVAFGVLLTSSWFSMSAVFLFVLGLACFVLYGADVRIHVAGVRNAQRA